MQVDTKFKEALPEATLTKIQGILASYGIETIEQDTTKGINHCYSMRVTAKGAGFGANGKGMTAAYSRASGYAEFMERMQAGYLGRRFWRDQVLVFADERRMSTADCLSSCADWIAQIRRNLSSLFGREIPESQLRRKLFESEPEDDTVTAIPFYDPKQDKTVWFPKRVMSFLYNSNGLAAGNNLTEAAVQSLSEIMERFNLEQMFFSSCVPPTIPDEYLRTFPRVYPIIEELRAAGLEVLVKDCSLGSPFPVVAAVVVDQARHSYHVHLGAFPAFEIALERSFTEMFQGRSLETVLKNDTVVTGDPRTRSNSELIDFLTYGTGRYPLSFFSDRPSWDFKPFPDRSNMSNEEMLREYMEYLDAKGYSIYLRDLSIMGFPTLRVVVPGMSESLPTQLLDRFPVAQLLERYQKAPLNPKELTEDERYEYRMLLDYLAKNYGSQALNLRTLSGRNLSSDNNVSRFLGRMVYAWMEWERSEKNAMAYARAAAEYAEAKDAAYLNCLCDYWNSLTGGTDRSVARSAYSVLYGKTLAEEVDAVLASGENPFARYLIHCGPERCEECAYRESCDGRASDALAKKIRAIAAEFDAKTAYEGLRERFGRLYR